MSEMDPKLMRRILGLGEVKEGGDPEVLARRKYHVFVAKWLAKWLPWLQVSAAIIGIVLIFLPAVWIEWRAHVIEIPVISGLFFDFHSIQGNYLLVFYFCIIMYIAVNFKAQDFPGGWDPKKQHRFPTSNEIVRLELYPVTKKEEFVFWLDSFTGFFVVPMWWLLLIGFISSIFAR